MMESLEHNSDGLSTFVAARPRLFGIAYRMLGSAPDAEDVVQDAWLRWQTTDRSVIRSAPAFLTTMTTRLAINLAQSARSRRETSPESWFPEPADASGDPEQEAERDEALERAVILLLETLSPTERAAYLLGEAFEYSCSRIADLLQVSDANARQIATRARKHLNEKKREESSSTERRRLLNAFILAAQTGELAPLEQVLNADVADRRSSPSSRRGCRIGDPAADAPGRADAQIHAQGQSPLAPS